MKSYNDKIATYSVLIAVIAIVVSVATPEIRTWLGFEKRPLDEAINKPIEQDATADKTTSSLSGQSTIGSSTIDQRLLGVWRYTHIRKSESGQMVTDYKIGFKNDGTYNTKNDWAGMGTSGEDPQQFGQYQIVSMTESGGIIKLDGKNTEYTFSEGTVQIGSIIYEYIRK